MMKKILSSVLFLAVISLGANVKAQTYCGVSSGFWGDFLGHVSSNLAVTNVTYDTSSEPNGSYSDETAQTFESFETQTFEINTGYVSGANTVNIWVDWDNDFLFDATELMSTQSGSNNAQTTTITIPSGTPLGDYRMRIRGEFGSGSNPPACGAADYGSTVDFTLTIVTAPNCLAPTNLSVGNGTGTAIDLSWTENSGATTWNIEYGPIGFSLGSGTSITGSTSNPITIPTTFGAEYDFYVQSDCGGGDLSAWSNPLSMKFCDVNTTSNYEYLRSITSVGAESDIGYSATNQPAGSYSDETTQTFESYETQTIIINTDYSGGENGVNIWVDWDNDMNFDASELVATGNDLNSTQSFPITIPLGTNMGEYRMRIRGEYGVGSNPSACGSAFYGSTVDFTLSIVTPPNCLTPTALNATNITATSADLGWTDNTGSSTWNIEYGIAGFAQGNGTVENGITSNPYSITLTPNTDHSFYVQSDCGGDVSAWSGPYTFVNKYCDFTISSTSPQYINSFETTGAVVDIINNGSGEGTTSVGYSDFTAMKAIGYGSQTIGFNLSGSDVATYGVSIYIDWNDDFTFQASEKVYASNGFENLPVTNSFTVPLSASVGEHRMRVVVDYYGEAPGACSASSAEAEDYTFEVINLPDCLPPSNLTSSNITQTGLDFGWVEVNTATIWNIEYGPTGFSQGSGTLMNAVTANPSAITGLNPSATYDFYVQSDCATDGDSYWAGPYSVATECGVSVAPFYEGFNSGTQPHCWENLSSDPSTGVNNFWLFNNPGDYGAANNGRNAGKFAKSDGSTPNPDSMMLITPEIDISNLTNPFLSFEWFSNNIENPGDNIPLIVELFDGTSWILLDTLRGDNPEWLFANYDLNAYANSTIKVRFMTNQTDIATTAQYNDILLDEVRIDDCLLGTGTDGSFDICRIDSTVNLNDNIIVKPNGGGTWSYPSHPNYLIDDTVFNVANLPVGSFEVLYVERFVCYDTTIATINVYGPSSAGTDGTITVCKNEPIDLYSALNGSVDVGGEWYDFSNMLLPTSQPKAENFAGDYNYNYIVSNGVCPADTALVEVTVRPDCDHLSIGEELFTDISVYPNPTTSQLNIMNPSNTSSLKVEMLDMNGRVVLIENKALNNASETTLSIDHLEKGIYTLRVYNNEGQKTFKIVKQ